MNIHGNLRLMGGGVIRNMRFEQLATDPSVESLTEARGWYNTTDKALKYFDGVEVQTIAKGGNLDDYLRVDGTIAMTDDLILSSADQSASLDTAAVSKGHVDAIAATKQDNITGAATTITSADLTAERAVISDASGKVAVSNVTTTELGYLSGVTSAVQDQLDGKQADLGYTPLNKAGDAWLGDQSANGYKVTNLAAPEAPNDAARKIDLDNAISNLNWQEDVLDIQVDNTLDPGATPATGDRYVITDAANLNANFGTIAGLEDDDIVQYDGTQFVVAFDMSAQGANSAGTFTTNLADGNFWRYSGSAWTSFDGVSAIVAGIGLVRNGNTFDVNMGAGISQLPTDEVGIDLFVNRGLMLTIDGTTSTTDAEAQLAVYTEAAGGLDFGVGGGLQVAAEGITAAMLGAVASNGLQGGEGVALSVLASDSSITVDATGVKVNETHLDGIYARQDGADFTGAVTVQAPTLDAHATTKLYVDQAVSAASGDVADLNSRVDAGHFVYDSTVTGTDTASATHTVAHNIGTKYVQVTVVDEADEVVIPDSVTFVDANTLTVGFGTAIKCIVICTAVQPAV